MNGMVIVLLGFFILVGILMRMALREKSKPAASRRRAVYFFTDEEARENCINTKRIPDVGGPIDIKSMSDEEFFNRVVVSSSIIYGNNPVSVSSRDELDMDVGRKAGEPWKLIFVEEMGIGDIIQIIVD
jgi:hypothetical protein